jgi:hypothetical protein
MSRELSNFMCCMYHDTEVQVYGKAGLTSRHSLISAATRVLTVGTVTLECRQAKSGANNANGEQLWFNAASLKEIGGYSAGIRPSVAFEHCSLKYDEHSAKVGNKTFVTLALTHEFLIQRGKGHVLLDIITQLSTQSQSQQKA